MTPGACDQEACDAPLASCNLGMEDLEECEYWSPRVRGDENGASSQDDGGTGVVPWVGGTLGRLDLDVVSARTTPYLVGLIGAHNAGKTTLLTILYLLLWRGRKLQQYRFRGSYTMGGWENLAYALRWQPGQPPAFPPHTSRASGRIPGLLHLAMTRSDGALRDVLFTDAPGEWFESWAQEQNSESATGARWTMKYASAVILIADCEALAGEQRGLARRQTIDLARRVSDTIEPYQKLAIVWSKRDCTVPDTVEDTLTGTFDRLFGSYRQFDISIYPTGSDNEPDLEAFLDLYDWVLSPNTGHGELRTPRVMNDQHPLFYRRW